MMIENHHQSNGHGGGDWLHLTNGDDHHAHVICADGSKMTIDLHHHEASACGGNVHHQGGGNSGHTHVSFEHIDKCMH